MPQIKFEKQFGKGTDPWYAKAERWAKKQKNPFTRHLLLGMIQWLKNKWIDAKIENTMRDVDFQSEQLLKQWEKNDKPKTRHIVEKGVFGDEGWSIEISNRSFGERTPTTSTGMDTGSDAPGLQKDEGNQGRLP